VAQWGTTSRTPHADLPPMGFLSRYLEYLLVLLVAAVAGAGLAYASSRDDDDEERAAPPRTTSTQAAVPTCQEAGITPGSTKSGTCRTRAATLTIVRQNETLRLADGTVRVLAAEALRATTPGGRARNRMRITLRLRVANEGKEPLALSEGERRIYLAAAGERVDPDTNAAREIQGALDPAEPIEPGGVATGTVRFELAGKVTADVLRARTAQLGVAVTEDRIGVVRLRFTEVG